MADIVNVLNTIISNDLESRVPTATNTNFQEVGNAILKYKVTTNKFVSALVDKVAFQIVNKKSFNNPLNKLKKGVKPYGKDIENIQVNPAKAVAYDIEKGGELLKVTKPDIETEYFRVNRQDQYPVSITRQSLKHAFTSPQSMEGLINEIKNSLISGDNIDEYTLMKKLYNDSLKSKKLLRVELPKTTTYKEILGKIRDLSSYFEFPSDKFNSYNAINKDEIASGTKTSRITWTDLEQQAILIRSDVLNSINMEVLASVFHSEKADIEGRIIKVDSFGQNITEGSAEFEVLAVVQDIGLTQVYDDENFMDEFYNPKTAVWNFYWNHWQSMGLSTLANGVAITRKVK